MQIKQLMDAGVISKAVRFNTAFFFFAFWFSQVF